MRRLQTEFAVTSNGAKTTEFAVTSYGANTTEFAVASYDAKTTDRVCCHDLWCEDYRQSLLSRVIREVVHNVSGLRQDWAAESGARPPDLPLPTRTHDHKANEVVLTV